MTENEKRRASVEVLRTVIFPAGPPRDGHILRLEHVGTWESQFLGIGRLTALSSESLLAERHAVDDAGLAVIFLQRHRVEVGLKLIRERTGQPVIAGHGFERLADECASGCAAAGMHAAWGRFWDAQGPYVWLLGEVDPGSMTFRYPVDRGGVPSQRAELVDLAELEAAGTAFERDVLALLAELAVLEPLPVMLDPLEVRDRLSAVAAAARELVTVSEQTLTAVQTQADELARRTSRRSERSAASARAQAAAADVALGTAALATRAELMADRITEEHALPDPPRASLPTVPAPPSVPMVLRPGQPDAHLDATIRWYTDAIVPRFRAFHLALREACDATAGWREPAGRQLQEELARMRSRISRNAPPAGAGDPG